jgi:hypothetical protein
VPESLPRPDTALHASSLGAVALCIVLWIRAKTVSQEQRGNAERRALFVGLWPVLLWLLGDEAGRRKRAGRFDSNRFRIGRR